MRYKKFIIWSFMFLLIISLPLLLILGHQKKINNVSVVDDESHLIDFNVIDNKVHINCCITLENNTLEEKIIKLSSVDKDDVDIGLLKDSHLYAIDENGNEFTGNISPKTKSKYNVTFVGEYGGNMQKSNRLVPGKISVEIVE